MISRRRSSASFLCSIIRRSCPSRSLSRAQGLLAGIRVPAPPWRRSCPVTEEARLPGADRCPAAPRGRGLRAAGCSDIRRILEQEFAARYSLDGVYKLLHRLGYSGLMPRPQHPDAAPGGSRSSSRRVVVEQIEAIAEQHPGEEVQVWHPRTRPASASKGRSRGSGRAAARGRAGCGRTGGTSLYVLTAVCAASGAAAGLIMPELNTAVINLFLEQFVAAVWPPGSTRSLLWDNAGYHVSGGRWWCPRTVSLIEAVCRTRRS